jgi:predicted ester cyclase
MESTTIVERFIREAWAGADADAMTETVSSEKVKEVFVLFNSAFTDVRLNDLGPIFSDADGGMVAFYGEMHIRQVADFLHVSAVGREADTGFTGIFRVEADKIAQMWVEVDFAALYAQTH